MSGYNYSTDDFLMNNKMGPNGTVPISLLNKFPRLSQFGFTDSELIDIIKERSAYLVVDDPKEQTVSLHYSGNT